MKSIELYKKADEELEEKEHKLAENIKSVEEEIASAKKRADKYLYNYSDKYKKAKPLEYPK